LSDAVSDYRAQVERNWDALEQNRADHRDEMLGEAAQDLGTLIGTGAGVDTSDPEEYRDSVQRIATDWGPRDDATLREAAAASDSADAPGPAPEPSATEPERAGPEPGEPWQ